MVPLAAGELGYFTAAKGAGTTVEVSFGSDSSPSNYAIGYWSIRGLGAPLTMMMCAAQTPFTLFLYDITEDGNGVPGGWTSEYFAAKRAYIQDYQQPLWNLPFCVDREHKHVIVQTNAVFGHLGRACGMLGQTAKETAECEQLLCELYDLRNIMVRYAYGGGETDVGGVIADGKKHFYKLHHWLTLQAGKTKDGKDVVHLVNGTYSAPDFHLYEMADQFEALATANGLEFYDGDEKMTMIQKFKKGFEALPENQLYLTSWLHTELPMNNCMARFGSLPGPNTYVYGESAKDASWRGKGSVYLWLIIITWFYQKS